MNHTAWMDLWLTCQHIVTIKFQIRKQYPDDIHYVLCPTCRNIKLSNNQDPNDIARKGIPTAWQMVEKTNELRITDGVPDVRIGSTFILPENVLRIQPSVPNNRIRPFPYIN